VFLLQVIYLVQLLGLIKLRSYFLWTRVAHCQDLAFVVWNVCTLRMNLNIMIFHAYFKEHIYFWRMLSTKWLMSYCVSSQRHSYLVFHLLAPNIFICGSLSWFGRMFSNWSSEIRIEYYRIEYYPFPVEVEFRASLPITTHIGASDQFSTMAVNPYKTTSSDLHQK